MGVIQQLLSAAAPASLQHVVVQFEKKIGLKCSLYQPVGHETGWFSIVYIQLTDHGCQFIFSFFLSVASLGKMRITWEETLCDMLNEWFDFYRHCCLPLHWSPLWTTYPSDLSHLMLCRKKKKTAGLNTTERTLHTEKNKCNRCSPTLPAVVRLSMRDDIISFSLSWA